MPQYYPKSQIESNLFTPGGSYKIFVTGEPYQGDYYATSNGKKYTGKFPGDGQNLEIVPIFNTDPKYPNQPPTNNPIAEQIVTDQPKYEGAYLDFDTNVYDVIRNTENTPKYLPTPNLTFPTNKDKKRGEFTRYFCKKNNESIFFEINKKTYGELETKSPTIAYEMYTPTSLKWTLKSNSQARIFLANKNTVTLKQNELGWFGFFEFFRNDFLKYSIIV